MSFLSRKALFGCLSEVPYKAIEAATAYCRARSHFYVDIAHWLHLLLQRDGSDVARIVAEYRLDRDIIARNVGFYLDQLPDGAASISDFEAHVERLVERSWLYASLAFSEDAIRSGHLIFTLLADENLRTRLLKISPEWRKIEAADLFDRLPRIMSGSIERSVRRVQTSLQGERGSLDVAPPPPAAGPGGGVFLSYSRRDGILAEDLVHDLRRHGIDVWWDQDMPGVDWQAELERQLDRVAVVLVIWSQSSIVSDNVRDEARIALSSHKLVNILYGVDKPRFPFDRINGIPLTDWDRGKGGPGWDRLLQAVRLYVEKTRPG